MEDGQIGTVKFVDHNGEERFTVQLYVTCRNNVYTIMIHWIFRVFHFLLFSYNNNNNNNNNNDDDYNN